MTDFLSRLAARAMGAADHVQPLIGSRYGDGASAAGFTEQAVERDAPPALSPSTATDHTSAAPDRGAPPAAVSSPTLPSPTPASAARSASVDPDGGVPRDGPITGSSDGLLLPESSNAASGDASGLRRTDSAAGVEGGLREVTHEVDASAPSVRQQNASAEVGGSASVDGQTDAPLMPLSPVAGPVIQRYAASGPVGGAASAAGTGGPAAGDAGGVATPSAKRAGSGGFETVDAFVDAAPPRSAGRSPALTSANERPADAGGEGDRQPPTGVPTAAVEPRSPAVADGSASTETRDAQFAGSPVAGDGLLMPGAVVPKDARASVDSAVPADSGFPGEIVEELETVRPAPPRSREWATGQPSPSAAEATPVRGASPASRAASTTASTEQRSSSTARSASTAERPSAQPSGEPRARSSSSTEQPFVVDEASDGLLMPRAGDGNSYLPTASGDALRGSELREIAGEVEAIPGRVSTDMPPLTGPPSARVGRRSATKGDPAPASNSSDLRQSATLRPAERREVVRHADGFVETVTLGDEAGTASTSRASTESSASTAVARRGEPVAVRTRLAERADDRRKQAEDAQAERPTIRISIGRIEVRAVHPPAPVVPHPAPQQTGWRAPVMSLEQYLKGGSGR